MGQWPTIADLGSVMRRGTIGGIGRKRPRRKKLRKMYRNSVKQQMFTIFGSNANGIKGKIESLKSCLNFFEKPSCVTIQESKLRFTGTVKLEGYQLFENISLISPQLYSVFII